MDLSGHQKETIRRVVRRELLKKGVNHDSVLVAIDMYNKTNANPSVTDLGNFFSLSYAEKLDLGQIIKDLQWEGSVEAYRDGVRKCLKIKQKPVLALPEKPTPQPDPPPAPPHPPAPKPKSGQKIPDDICKRVVKLHKSGKNGIEISEILGISQSAVSRTLSAAGIRRIAIKGSWIEKRDRKIIDMINSGMTRREIADEFGMSEKTIGAIIRKRYGVYYKRQKRKATTKPVKPVEKVGLIRRIWRWLY